MTRSRKGGLAEPTRLAVIVMNIAEQVLLEEGDAKLHMGIEVVATRPCHLSFPASVPYVLSVSKYSYSAHGFLGTDIAHSICESPFPPLIHIPSAIKAMHNTTKLLIQSGPPGPSISIYPNQKRSPWPSTVPDSNPAILLGPCPGTASLWSCI